jgi:predicted RNA-binding Zn ribbon-like protein
MMLDPNGYTGTYKVIGGELCLDFANTISWRGTGRAHEWLHNPSNFILWGQLVGILNEQETALLLDQAEQNREDGGRVLERAWALREAINSIFSSLETAQPIPSESLNFFNAQLPETLIHLHVDVQANKGNWVWQGEGLTLDQILWPVVWSAANLLMSDSLEKLRSCEACDWLFIDTTKNHSRRWCTMEDCGNRAKVRRFRQRGQNP